MIQLGFGLLSMAGIYVSVGLVGNQINIPLFPFVTRGIQLSRIFLGKLHRPE